MTEVCEEGEEEGAEAGAALGAPREVAGLEGQGGAKAAAEAVCLRLPGVVLGARARLQDRLRRRQRNRKATREGRGPSAESSIRKGGRGSFYRER